MLQESHIVQIIQHFNREIFYSSENSNWIWLVQSKILKIPIKNKKENLFRLQLIQWQPDPVANLRKKKENVDWLIGII